MNSGTVDLIYLDPPFNSKKQYKAPIGTPAEGQSFDDTWRWTDLDDKWLGEIDRRNEALSAIIRAARLTQGNGTAAYLTMMGIRFLELHRVLKSTGSIYLHCDPTANSYLRICMDAVFGKDNMRNEIAWCYTGVGNATKQFKSKHDTIYFYAKSKASPFNVDAVRKPYKRSNPSSGATSFAAGGRSQEERYRLERESIERGKLMEDWWDDVGSGGHISKKERTGWATQKPLKLLQRIIKVSSNPGDMVLDPFAGCATCCVAAEIEGRQWVGIEACEEATNIVRERLDEADLGNLGHSRPRAIVKRSVPCRTDAPPPAKPKRTHGYKSADNLATLYGQQFGDCNGCGVHYHVKDFHHDHIHPRSKDGGDEIGNLQLLCGNCNSTKHANSMEYLWGRLYERQFPISPAGWEYLKQSGCKDWRIA